MPRRWLRACPRYISIFIAGGGGPYVGFFFDPDTLIMPSRYLASLALATEFRVIMPQRRFALQLEQTASEKLCIVKRRVIQIDARLDAGLETGWQGETRSLR